VTKIRLAIIGSGPSSTYAMDRLAANLSVLGKAAVVDLEVYVFERSGNFGAGEVHSPKQPKSSFLNRIAGQVSFAADETNVDARYLLAREDRPSLSEWCQRKYKETGDDAYNIAATDWPKRYLHGEALCERFDRYVEIINSLPYSRVMLVPDEVVDIDEEQTRFNLITASGKVFVAEEILLCTGHQWHRNSSFDGYSVSNEEERKFVETRLIPCAYPLESLREKISHSSRICIIGLGLTAIDVFMYFTEGLGGRFEEVDNGKGAFEYIPSGNEPEKMIGFSRSGMFTYARPVNAKEENIAKYEHQPVFLKKSSIDTLRRTRGVPTLVDCVGLVRQLDFEKDVLPLIRLEKAYVYYKTLLGEELGDLLVQFVSADYFRFLQGDIEDQCTHKTEFTYFERRINEFVQPYLKRIDAILTQDVNDRYEAADEVESAIVSRFCRFISFEVDSLDIESVDVGMVKKVLRSTPEVFIHDPLAESHLYSWNVFMSPVDRFVRGDEPYAESLIRFMEYDHYQARQNNLRNPFKAACDALWRDLRQEMAYSIDRGGLNPRSHKRFLTDYMTIHNRLGNGACLEVMEKMLSLLKCGIIDAGFARNPRVQVTAESGNTTLELVARNEVSERVMIDYLIDAKLHDCNPSLDRTSLLSKLARKGIVRKWSNTSSSQPSFQPGGIALSAHFHPVGSGGEEDERITFVGPVSEGVYFFQIGAARPNQNHHVLNDIISWANRFIGRHYVKHGKAINCEKV
jgi:hypothetical protein